MIWEVQIANGLQNGFGGWTRPQRDRSIRPARFHGREGMNSTSEELGNRDFFKISGMERHPQVHRTHAELRRSVSGGFQEPFPREKSESMPLRSIFSQYWK